MTSKYFNKKTEIDGIIFDSQKEARRYCELRALLKAGKIKNLEIQPKFELIPKFRKNGENYRAIMYVADFRYSENDIVIVEDVKSDFTRKNPVYLLKKKLFLSRYEFVFKEV